MTYRIINRKYLKSSEWLANVATMSWQQIQPPSRNGLHLQEFDLAAELNTALAEQQIRDVFEAIVQEAGNVPLQAIRVESDGRMAVAIHKAFHGITRREASDPDFWAYVTCFGCPWYVRWRWETSKRDALWNRFAGNIRRNAISRLWWWAEITCDHALPVDDPQRYKVTMNVRNRQSLMLWFIDCAFSGQTYIARKLAGLQEERALNDNYQKTICRTINRLARVVCLDLIQTEEQAEALCQHALKISQQLATQ